MAGEALESTFIIQDEASSVLDEIAKQADITGDALANVQSALNGLNAVGDVRIVAEANEEDATVEKATSQGELQPEEIAQAQGINVAAIQEMNAQVEEAAQIMQEMPASAEEAASAAETSMAELENELNDTIDLSVLDEINQQNEESWERLLNEINESAEEILDGWQSAEDEMQEIPRESANTGRGIRAGIKGLGADIAGWWEIIKDVFNKIKEVFLELAEEADKLAMKRARYGLVADSEGLTGAARTDRANELYKEQQKFAQALGVTSEAFNETVMNMYSNGQGVLKDIRDAQIIAASSFMAMDIAGLRGKDKDAVMGEVQSMISVGIADPDQIQETMKIAPNILRTIEQQWQKNQNGKAFKLSNGEEIDDATGKIAVLAQEGQITAELVAQAMVNSAEATNKTWNTLPQTWEKIQNRAQVLTENIKTRFLDAFASMADSPVVENLILSVEGIFNGIMDFVDILTPMFSGILSGIGSAATGIFDIIAGLFNYAAGIAKWVFKVIGEPIGAVVKIVGEIIEGIGGGLNKIFTILPYVASNIWKTGDIFKSMIRGIKSYFMEFVNWFMEKLAGLLEMAGELSDTLAETAKEIRAGIAYSREEMAEYDRESEEIKKSWMGDEYEEYAAKNDLRWSDGLNISGFLEDIVKGQEMAPGTKKNPAEVRGKVAIDGEYFDVIKRAAGVEIVNRYTTLRPTVNARFGDIHQMDARDVIGELGRQIQDAEGAALSDAQALGA